MIDRKGTRDILLSIFAWGVIGAMIYYGCIKEKTPPSGAVYKNGWDSAARNKYIRFVGEQLHSLNPEIDNVMIYNCADDICTEIMCTYSKAETDTLKTGYLFEIAQDKGYFVIPGSRFEEEERVDLEIWGLNLNSK